MNQNLEIGLDCGKKAGVEKNPRRYPRAMTQSKMWISLYMYIKIRLSCSE